MTLLFPETESVPLKTDPDGTVRIKGTRVILDLVIQAFNDGASAEMIAHRYTTLDLADVYAVIAYYLRHQDDVDAYLSERQKEADALRKEIEAKFKPDGLRERLLARRAKQRLEQV